MEIIIRNSSGQPIYEQIYSQLRSLILDGTLQEGEMLPSIRALAKDLRISVITTKRAYEELEHDGFIYTVAGKGCFVASRNLDFVREEYLGKIEQHLSDAMALARQAGIPMEELIEILHVLEGENEE